MQKQRLATTLFSLIFFVFALNPVCFAFNFDNALRGLQEKARDVGEQVNREFQKHSESWKQSIERSSRDFKRKSQDYLRRAEKKSRQWVDKNSRTIQRQTLRTLQRAEREIKNYSRKYGNKAARDFKQACEKYGTQARRTIQDAADRYGESATKAVSEAYARHGPSMGRKVAEAYAGLSDRSRDLVSKAYHRWDATKAIEISKTIRRYGHDTADTILSSMARYGKDAGTCLHKTYQELGSRYGKSLHAYYQQESAQLARTFSRWGRQARIEFLDAFEQVESKHFKKIEQVYQRFGSVLGQKTAYAAKRVARSVQDPATQDKALSATMVSCRMISRVRKGFKHGTVDALRRTCRQVVVEDPYGRKLSLEAHCRTYIARKHPYLKGTSIEDDPVGSLTYVLAFQDVGYMTKEMKIVQTHNGDYASLQEAIVASSPQDPETTLAALEAIEAFDTLTDEDINEEDILLAAEMINKANTTRRMERL